MLGPIFIRYSKPNKFYFAARTSDWHTSCVIHSLTLVRFLNRLRGYVCPSSLFVASVIIFDRLIFASCFSIMLIETNDISIVILLVITSWLLKLRRSRPWLSGKSRRPLILISQRIMLFVWVNVQLTFFFHKHSHIYLPHTQTETNKYFSEQVDVTLFCFTQLDPL